MRSFLSSVVLFTAIAALALLSLACSSEPVVDPLIYREGFSGNISSLYGSVGPARHNANDPSPPDFRWRDSTGALDSLSGQVDKIVVLTFFAKWCGPCNEEAPAFEAFYQKHKSDVEIIGIDVDANGDVFNIARDFASKYGQTFQIVTDSAFRVYNAYIFAFDNFSIPYTFFIGRDGEIKTYHKGSANQEILEAMLAKTD
jgi:peroxiredoxin